jgi:hypothetical protein
MRPSRIALFAALLALPPAWAAASPSRAKSSPADGLVVEGDVLVVVQKLPFDVVGPAGADLYFWRLPPGWKASEAANRLTVSEAPQGAAVVGLQTLRVDWGAKKTLTKAYALTVNVGKAAPPPGPDDALAKAFASEADPLKVAHAAKLASLYRAWEKAVVDTPPPTWGKLFEAMAASSKTLGLSDKIPAVRTVLAAEFRATFPTSSALPLGPDGRALASATFGRAAARLEALR